MLIVLDEHKPKNIKDIIKKIKKELEVDFKQVKNFS